MKRFFYTLLFLLSLMISVSSQATSPKQEFRAAWISTVANIDWPSTPGLSVDKMKEELITILNYLKATNLNAVIFQIRPACDAMYNSPYEPWSYWLTGEQGKAPADNFDPLAFAVEETHKRGMELHAWFNPYRITKKDWSLSLHKNNVAVQHPEWVLNIGGDKILDPGLPQVREFVTNIVGDVVTRYDIDAVHFDDYFYLDNMASSYDAASFAAYPNGFTNLGDWRRNNVNELLRMIYAKINSIKPYVKFGQSPRGIWKNGVPTGISGSDTYSVINCDAVTWLSEKIIDYLAPQLYWSFGGGQDYGKLMPWWVSQSNSRHIYPGLAYYRVGTSGFDQTQLGKMVSLNRQTNGCQGQIFFTANDFKDNTLGNTDTLKNNYFKYKAFIPTMSWKDNSAPQTPSNLRFERVSGTGVNGLTWDVTDPTDSRWYALYKFSSSNFTADDLKNPANIKDVTSNRYFTIDSAFPNEKAYYVVTALDRNYNESGMSNKFEFQPGQVLPSIPSLVLPIAEAADIKDTMKIVWKYSPNASAYNLEISDNINFTNIITRKLDVVDTSIVITGLRGETNYFLRVKSKNNVGESEFSEIRKFRTAFPGAPSILEPLAGAFDINLISTFKWLKRSDALKYKYELFEGKEASYNKLVLSQITTDTSFISTELKPTTFYSWRVKAYNSYGEGNYSNITQFKTLTQLPVVPVLISPVENQSDLKKTASFKWNKARYALYYEIELAADQNFTNKIATKTNVFDTTTTIENLSGETTYFWRVNSANNSGKSNYSVIKSFKTGFPAAINPLSPVNKTTNISVNPVFTWKKSKIANKYQFQLSYGTAFSSPVDTLLSDTTVSIKALKTLSIYSWRVKAINDLGESDWSETFMFKTDASTDILENNLPAQFKLYQNYPNPFNPSTNIKFDIPVRSYIRLSVYNLIGEEIAILINREMEAGSHSIVFNASKLSSGIYFYKLTTDSNVFFRKMMLIK